MTFSRFITQQSPTLPSRLNLSQLTTGLFGLRLHGLPPLGFSNVILQKQINRKKLYEHPLIWCARQIQRLISDSTYIFLMSKFWVEAGSSLIFSLIYS